jgi:hypothetical protein
LLAVAVLGGIKGDLLLGELELERGKFHDPERLTGLTVFGRGAEDNRIVKRSVNPPSDGPG